MPLLRYFLYVGAALVALLFTITWYLPPLEAEPARADADRTTIRIHSQHKWPSAVVFDTTLPTIVPPQAPVVAAEAPAPRPVREALAMLPEPPADKAAPSIKPAEAAKPAKRHVRRTRVARIPASPPGFEPFGFRSAWAVGW
jgi:hypothetical protein